MKGPNLFIVGAQKSGTTSLHSYLGRHPDVFMSEPKEPGFFVPELDGYYSKEDEWYSDLFKNGQNARYRGEASTHYTKRPVYEGVAERIHNAAPEAHIIYLMREPVSRAISHYWHNLHKFEEHRSIISAMQENPVYKAFGDYAFQLEPYLRVFGSNRVFTLTFETLTSNPLETVNSLLKWLDLSPSDHDITFTKENARPEVFEAVRGQGRLQRFRESELWDRASHFVPKPLRTLGKKMAVGPAVHSEIDEPEVRARLAPWAKEVVARTSALLAREFPEWEVPDL